MLPSVNTDSKPRVVVAMSGGVDSSTAAAILKEQGFDLVGITLKLWPQDCLARLEDKCCGPQAVMDARNVCHRLGIPFYLVDEADEFKRNVIDYFVAEYRAARTPNPCVICNEKLKFGALLSRARKLGAQHVATGHYARIEKGPDGRRWLLKRGADLQKDQSYFLFSLRQDQLAQVMMPLGHLSKDQTRALARQTGLKTADKPESMEICFVPDRDYGQFLTAAAGVGKHQGQIVNLQGQVIGCHDGIEFFTIGQRRGLGISSTRPLYVIELDAVQNRVVLGDVSALECAEFLVERCNWIPFDQPPPVMTLTVKIRYKHSGAPATVTPLDNGRAKVSLDSPQRAVTPGQACVFYDGDLVVGGGWITR
ncbi:MAG: tRNA 2-thiouridine(34) synthase MnmA [Candidatus Omnitrophica bacterium]|nr:tRNA 2-thiouridine(34) synthase MnmA [Candidatus Omnitrophota bacterium]